MAWNEWISPFDDNLDNNNDEERCH
jgi:hypothetical protein